MGLFGILQHTGYSSARTGNVEGSEYVTESGLVELSQVELSIWLCSTERSQQRPHTAMVGFEGKNIHRSQRLKLKFVTQY